MDTNTNIYTFLDYREYLKQSFEELKNSKHCFNYTYFAKKAEMGSTSYLRMVIKGQRNIKPDTSKKFAKALNLTKKQSDYFQTMVLFNQAKNEQEQDEYFNRLVKLRPLKFLKEINADQYEYFTNRYYVTIREMVALPNFKEDPEWIAKSIVNDIKAEDVVRAFEVLQNIGLIARDENGKLIHSNSTVSTPPNVDSIDIYNYHRSLLTEAKNSMAFLKDKTVDLAGMTIPIPKDSIEEVKRIMQKCREDIANYICHGSNDYHEVFQINMQMFPLTQSSKIKDSTKESNENLH
jgi:uncharacterized protein (TIGR02147 family)